MNTARSFTGAVPPPRRRGANFGSNGSTRARNPSGTNRSERSPATTAIYLEQRREDLPARMVEAMRVLDGSLEADVVLLTRLSTEEIDTAGGIDE